MMWQPYERQRIGSLDAVLAEQLDTYLDQRENKLCFDIMGAAQLLHTTPALDNPVEYSARLHEAVEDFGRKARRAAQLPDNHPGNTDLEAVSDLLNKALWSYTETLEGSVMELFHQLSQTGFEYWDIDLFQAVGEIKDGLMHKLEDLIWAIRRLEQQLREYYCLVKGKGRLSSWWMSWRRFLDPSLESTAAKCRKYLGFKYQKFTAHYNGFLQLYTQAEQTLKKFHQYRTLSSMGSATQYQFKKIYLLLRLWDLNKSAKVLSQNDFIRSLRGMVSSESAMALFKDYYAALRSALFDKGRMIKKGYRTVFHDQDVRKYIVENVMAYQVELHTLVATVEHYRDFLLRTDPNPYVRSRWGFSEWVVGQEPKASKRLQSLAYDLEHLDKLYDAFLTSLQDVELKMQTLTPKMEKRIDGHLHEMGQPLASKEVISHHMEAVLTLLKQLDELGSFQSEVVGYVCRILCRLMRADRKYHIAQQNSDFHSIYEIHQGLVMPLEDRQHLHRLQKFVRLIEKLEQRLEGTKTAQGVNDIELDVNDIRAYLQDFLAQVQRLKRSENGQQSEEFVSAAANLKQTLLEYRYLFSGFFNRLSHHEPEQRLVRRQLLFVDQYFEAIEDCMEEIYLPS